MKKDIKTIREIFQSLACVINCNTSAAESCELMDLLEKHGGSMMKKWGKYCDANHTRKAGMADLKKLLTKLTTDYKLKGK